MRISLVGDYLLLLIRGLLMPLIPIRAFGQPLDTFVANVLERVRTGGVENGRIPSQAVLSGTLERGGSESV